MSLQIRPMQPSCDTKCWIWDDWIRYPTTLCPHTGCRKGLGQLCVVNESHFHHFARKSTIDHCLELPNFVIGVRLSAVCRIYWRIWCSWFWSRVGCFLRFPGGSRPYSSNHLLWLRGQWNALTNELNEIGKLCFTSAVSWTWAICWHRNSILSKIASVHRNLQTDLWIQTSVRCGKRTSSGTAGRVAVLCNFIARWLQLSNEPTIPSGVCDLAQSFSHCQLWIEQS
jgi:hypothetical protein